MGLYLHQVGDQFRVWTTEQDTYLPGEPMSQDEARAWTLRFRIENAVREYLRDWQWAPGAEKLLEWRQELAPFQAPPWFEREEERLFLADIEVKIKPIEGGERIEVIVKPYPSYGQSPPTRPKKEKKRK